MLEFVRRPLYQWHTRRKNECRIDALQSCLADNTPILLVHQMGRAGSMTTVNTLRAASLSFPVFHTHWLNPESVKLRQEWNRHLSWNRQPLNIRTSSLIAAELAREGTSRRQWKLVTVFREPVARNLSVFFLCIDAFVEDFQRRYERGGLDGDVLLDVFLQRFPHDQPLAWFDREVREVFGVDVYAYDFPADQGYCILQADRVELLLVKVEQLNRCFRSAFREFLGVDVPQLQQSHVTEADPAMLMYRDFIRTVRLPDAYLDRMYSSRFARHFYPDEEIRGFRSKWSRGER